MLTRMDAAQALADLTEISSQVIQVAIFGPDRSLLASTIADPAVAARFCAILERLETEADLQAKLGGLGGPLTQLEVSALEGSVFVVRSPAGTIAATTRPDPTVGLVLYDLKRCLESLAEPAGTAEGAGTSAPPLAAPATEPSPADSLAHEVESRA
jgi:predicted regulator of Ras-like GTPase activity (Roadblock/LC7/MglB family)